MLCYPAVWLAIYYYIGIFIRLWDQATINRPIYDLIEPGGKNNSIQNLLQCKSFLMLMVFFITHVMIITSEKEWKKIFAMTRHIMPFYHERLANGEPFKKILIAITDGTLLNAIRIISDDGDQKTFFFLNCPIFWNK